MTEREWIYNGVEFKVGDKVLIFTTEVTGAENAMGEGVDWDNAWIEDMDYAVGGVHEIESINEYGVEFVQFVNEPSLTPHMGYLYPLSVLAKVG